MIEIIKYCEVRSAALEAWRRISNFEATAAPSGSPPADYTPYTPITIVEVEGFNDGPAPLYWQIHDGVALPASGSPALHSIRVPAGGTFSWEPRGGFQTSDGGLWVASSAPATYVEPAEVGFWVLVQFLPLHSPTIFSDGP